MDAETTDPGPSKDRKSPRLVLLARRGAAFLEMPIPELSLIITVRLTRRQSEVVLALNDLLNQDEEDGVARCARGWMTDREIGSAIAGIGLPPQPNAVRAYRSQINRGIKRATPEGCEPPELFETEYEVGVRLTGKIIVVDGRRPRRP